MALTMTITAHAADTIYVQTPLPRFWHTLCPQVFSLQYAGNIGMFSLGIGWDYGKHERWETMVQLGFVPGIEGYIEGAPSFTLRQNLVPWQVPLGPVIEGQERNHGPHLLRTRHRWAFTPAVFSFSINSIASSEFWIREPRKYNNGNYYRFSSKFRLNIGIGQRIDLMLPQNSFHKQQDRLSIYYDLSTYDLAIISAIPNKSISMVDILALGIGVQYKFW